jgi:hypothetical protein
MAQRQRYRPGTGDMMPTLPPGATMPGPSGPQTPKEAPAWTPVTTPDRPSMGSYFSDPVLQGYLNFGQGAVNKLSGPQGSNAALQQAIAALTKISNSRGPSVDTSFLNEFGNTVRARQAELNQPGYTQSQQDLLRTNVSDPLTAQRDARRQQVTERMASRGIQPGSGIMEQALQDVDREYSQTRATGERELTTNLMAQDEQRKNQAVDIGSALASLGLSTEGLRVSAQNAGTGNALSAAGALGGIGGQQQALETQRLMNAYGIYGDMAQMPFRANANAIASAQALEPDSTDNIIKTLLALAGGGENIYRNSLANSGAGWDQLARYAGSDDFEALLRVFSGLGNRSDSDSEDTRPAPAPRYGGLLDPRLEPLF